MSSRKSPQQWKERLEAGETFRIHANPWFVLLVKYNGELLNATPHEIAEATKKSGTPGKAARKRREAVAKYNREYDENGVRRFL